MANTIASERTRMGLSQEELAKKVGKSRAVITRWEKDPSAINGTYLCMLADMFDCSIDYLMGRTSERTYTAIA
jgi:transcriptional regulator with XRE-family HTH domain